MHTLVPSLKSGYLAPAGALIGLFALVASGTDAPAFTRTWTFTGLLFAGFLWALAGERVRASGERRLVSHALLSGMALGILLGVGGWLSPAKGYGWNSSSMGWLTSMLSELAHPGALAGLGVLLGGGVAIASGLESIARWRAPRETRDGLAAAAVAVAVGSWGVYALLLRRYLATTVETGDVVRGLGSARELGEALLDAPTYALACLGPLAGACAVVTLARLRGLELRRQLTASALGSASAALVALHGFGFDRVDGLLFQLAFGSAALVAVALPLVAAGLDRRSLPSEETSAQSGGASPVSRS